MRFSEGEEKMKERRRFNRFNLSVLAGAIFVIMGLLSQNGHAVQKHPVHKHKHKHISIYIHIFMHIYIHLHINICIYK